MNLALHRRGIADSHLENHTPSTNSNNFGNNALYLFSRGGSQLFTRGRDG